MLRGLTKEEITDIVSTCDIKNTQFIKVLKDLLKNTKIVPEGIQELKEIIAEKYKSDTINHNIGITTAESII